MTKPLLYCSFCSKSHKEVRKLIGGPKINGYHAFICDECVDLCKEIIEEDSSLSRFHDFFRRKSSLAKFDEFFKVGQNRQARI